MKEVAIQEAKRNIGKSFSVMIDRPFGSSHPKHPNIIYPINYGYIPGLIGGDQEEQDVYVIDSQEQSKVLNVTIIAVIYRQDDVETKWVGVVDHTKHYTNQEIMDIVHFQEQYYTSQII